MGAYPVQPFRPPEQPDALGSEEKIMSLRNLIQQSQLGQGQVQLQQQQLKDQSAMTAAMKNWDGKDYDALSKSVLQNGGSANAATQIQQHGLTIKKTVSDIAAQDATSGSKNLETYINSHKAIGDALEGLDGVPDDQLHQKAADTVKQLAGTEIMPGQPLLPPQQAQQLMQGIQTIQDPKQLRDQIDIMAKTSQGAKATAEQAKEASSNRLLAAQAGKAENELNIIQQYKQNPNLLASQVDAVAPADKYGSLNARTKANVRLAMQTGDVDGAKAAIQKASEEVGGIEKEVNPQVQAGKVAVSTAEGQARAATEAQVARGSNAALAQVPPHLVAPATAAAEKAGADYAQSVAATKDLQDTLDAAKRGNVESYQLLPLEGVLQVVTSQGIRRINMAEVQQYQGGGSLWQRLEGHIGKAVSGKSIPDSVLNDMAEMQKIQADGAKSKYENTLKAANQNYGSNFKPVDMGQGSTNKEIHYKIVNGQLVPQ